AMAELGSIAERRLDRLINPRWRQDAQALLSYLVQTRIERLFLPCVALQHLAQTAVSQGVYPQALREVIT
ncbi:amino acid adenylation, partial [Pseudomonas syringae pv. japonica str. M301072]